MKTSENSQPTLFPEMELPLMSSAEGFRAKILALQESAPAWAKEREVGFGLSASGLLASYDPSSQSLRTSQTCFLAQAKNEGGGLAEYSQTWPPSGMMRSGRIYQRQPWALPIAESASGLWPTPLKSSKQALFAVKTIKKCLNKGSQEHLCYRPTLMGWSRHQIATIYATAMGFPSSWASLTLTETP